MADLPKPRSAIRETTIVGGAVSDSDAPLGPPDSKPNSKAKAAPTVTIDSGYRPGHIARGLRTIYIQIGSYVKLLDPILGDAIIANSKKCAESLDLLAKESPAVRRALESMLSTNAWVGVIVAHAPLFMAIAPVRNRILQGMRSMVGEEFQADNLSAVFMPSDGTHG